MPRYTKKRRSEEIGAGCIHRRPPLSASLPFTNFKSTPKTLGRSLLTDSDSPLLSSPPSPLTPLRTYLQLFLIIAYHTLQRMGAGSASPLPLSSVALTDIIRCQRQGDKKRAWWIPPPKEECPRTSLVVVSRPRLTRRFRPTPPPWLILPPNACAQLPKPLPPPNPRTVPAGR